MDGALIERARRGDADAFDEICRQRIDSVYRTALGILGNPSDARDATQETLIAAWRSVRSLRDAAKFDSWLYRVTVNAAKMVARRHRGGVEIRPINDADALSAPQPRAGVIAASDFDAAFEALTVDQRALLLAHHLDGLPVSELAERLRIPVGTVKSRLFTARQALERAMNEDH